MCKQVHGYRDCHWRGSLGSCPHGHPVLAQLRQPGFELNLNATCREAAGGDAAPEHGAMLRAIIRW